MNDFRKKQWTRIGLSLVALIAATLFLAGIIGGKPMTYQIGVNENALTATEKGFAGDVTVHVEFGGDKTVKSLTIDTPDETEGLGKRASEAAFTDQFIGKAGPFTFGENGIEALSGATVTSRAALKAINSLLTDGESAAEPTEAPAAEPTEAPEQPTEAPAEVEAVGTALAIYQAEKQTDYSVIRVQVTAEGGKITDCVITSEGDYDYLTDKVRTAWAASVVENQSAETDVISGATLKYSAKAVKEAIAEIKAQLPAEAAGDAAQSTYKAEKQTDYSVIRVQVTVEDGKITDCVITSEGDYDYLTDKVRTAWAASIVENQSAETDAISGATLKYSAKAVKEAMEEIMNQVSGK